MKLVLIILVAAIAVFGLIQLVPYGRNHQTPPVTQEVKWVSPQTRELAVRACYDCHSNETQWPWYSNIAPISWLVEHDVAEGRRELNFSEADRRLRRADEAAGQVRRDNMPQWYYVLLHPEANLSTAEKQTLIQGLSAMFGERQGGEKSQDSDED